MTNLAIFNGSADEALELVDILNRYCTDPDGERCRKHRIGDKCGVHEMMFDQRVLDHLVWARHVSFYGITGEGVDWRN